MHIMPLRQFHCYCGLGLLNLGNRQDSCRTFFEERTQNTTLLGENQFTKACRKETSCITVIQGWSSPQGVNFPFVPASQGEIHQVGGEMDIGYLVRVPGNDHHFVYANHLIPDNARGMGTPEMITPERLEYNPPLDFQKTPVIPTLRSQIQSEDNEISR